MIDGENSYGFLCHKEYERAKKQREFCDVRTEGHKGCVKDRMATWWLLFIANITNKEYIRELKNCNNAMTVGNDRLWCQEIIYRLYRHFVHFVLAYGHWRKNVLAQEVLYNEKQRTCVWIQPMATVWYRAEWRVQEALGLISAWVWQMPMNYRTKMKTPLMFYMKRSTSKCPYFWRQVWYDSITMLLPQNERHKWPPLTTTMIVILICCRKQQEHQGKRWWWSIIKTKALKNHVLATTNDW